MSSNVGAILMVGPGKSAPAEQLVQKARYASTIDLIALLQQQQVSPIILSSPSFEWVPPELLQGVALEPDPADQVFHFGRQLATLIRKYSLRNVLYFGGGSVPLLQATDLQTLTALLASAHDAEKSTGHGLTNNIHSSDWLGFTEAARILETVEEADRDNSLAWLLDQRADYMMHVPDGWNPAASLDIDTPTDLALISHHPALQQRLGEYLNSVAPALSAIPVQQIARIGATFGSNLTIIGRVSPPAWHALNRATQCWTRVFSEERGMVASGRQARGEVQSLVANMIRQQGPHQFFNTLSSMTDAAIIDNRPLMAANGLWPSDAERFASDLFQLENIKNQWLADFTQAAQEAPIPVMLGGHSAVSSGLYVVVELVKHLQS